MNYKHLGTPNGRNNLGGVAMEMAYAPLSAFDVNGIKKLKTTNLAGDAVTIDGPHVFLLDEGFIKIYGTVDRGRYKGNSIGALDGKGLKIEGEIFHPGTEKDAAEFQAKSKNDVFILMTKETNGKTLQTGSEDIPCFFTGDYDAAELESGTKGFVFKFMSYQNSLQYYDSPLTYKVIP